MKKAVCLAKFSRFNTWKFKVGNVQQWHALTKRELKMKEEKSGLVAEVLSPSSSRAKSHPQVHGPDKLD